MINALLVSVLLLGLLGTTFLQALTGLSSIIMILAIVAFLSCSLQFICMIFYYLSLRDLVNGKPWGVHAELGNGIAIWCVGLLFCWIGAVGVVVDSLARLKFEKEQWLAVEQVYYYQPEFDQGYLDQGYHDQGYHLEQPRPSEDEAV